MWNLLISILPQSAMGLFQKWTLFFSWKLFSPKKYEAVLALGSIKSLLGWKLRNSGKTDICVLHIFSTCPESECSLMVPVKVAAPISGAQETLFWTLWNTGNLCFAPKNQMYLETEKLELISQDQKGSCILNSVVLRFIGVAYYKWIAFAFSILLWGLATKSISM